MDCKACGAPLARSARGRAPDYCNDRCRKAGQRVREAATQLSLEFEASSDVTEGDEQADMRPVQLHQLPRSEGPVGADVTRDPEQHTPTPNTATTGSEGGDPANWTRYSHADLCKHDAERRAWLRQWAEKQNFKAFPYRSHWRGKGFIMLTVPEGKAKWTNFTSRATQYGVYCCFVEAYAPGQLETSLSEAAQRGAIQLDDQSTAEPAESAAPEIQNDISELDPATLTSYSQEMLRHLGAHDQARRAWLREWARSRDYRASWFTVHGRYSGYYQTGIPAGEEGWMRFLERGGSYDVYCLFVAAFTPDIPLQRYLEDASARGEMVNALRHEQLPPIMSIGSSSVERMGSHRADRNTQRV